VVLVCTISEKQKTSWVPSYAKSFRESSQRTMLCYFKHMLTSLISSDQIPAVLFTQCCTKYAHSFASYLTEDVRIDSV